MTNRPADRSRDILSRVTVAIACIAALFAVVVLITGGFGTSLMGLRVSAHHPERAAVLAVASFLLAVVLVGYRHALGIANGYLVAVSHVVRPERRLIVSVMQVS